MKRIFFLTSACLLCMFLLNGCFMITRGLSDEIHYHRDNRRKLSVPKYKEFTTEYKKAYITSDYLTIYSSNGGYYDKPNTQVVYKYKLDHLNDTILDTCSLIIDKKKSLVVKRSDIFRIFQNDSIIRKFNCNGTSCNKYYDIEKKKEWRYAFYTEQYTTNIIRDSIQAIYFNINRFEKTKLYAIIPYKDYSYSENFKIDTYNSNKNIDTIFNNFDSIPILNNICNHLNTFYTSIINDYSYKNYNCYFPLNSGSRNYYIKMLKDSVNYYLNLPGFENGYLFIPKQGDNFYCRYDSLNNILISKINLPKRRNNEVPFTYVLKSGFYAIIRFNPMIFMYLVTIPLDIITAPIQLLLVFDAIMDPHFSLTY